MRMHPYSPGRRNSAPSPMSGLVDIAKKQVEEIETYNNSTAYQKASLGIKRKHGGSKPKGK